MLINIVPVETHNRDKAEEVTMIATGARILAEEVKRGRDHLWLRVAVRCIGGPAATARGDAGRFAALCSRMRSLEVSELRIKRKNP